VDKIKANCKTPMVRRNDLMVTEKKKVPNNAPTGNPINNRSKNKEGMMKKLRSLKITKVNTTVEKDNRNSARPMVVFFFSRLFERFFSNACIIDGFSLSDLIRRRVSGFLDWRI